MEERQFLSLNSHQKGRPAYPADAQLWPLRATRKAESDVKVHEAYKRHQDEKIKAAARQDATERKFCLG